MLLKPQLNKKLVVNVFGEAFVIEKLFLNLIFPLIKIFKMEMRVDTDKKFERKTNSLTLF